MFDTNSGARPRQTSPQVCVRVYLAADHRVHVGELRPDEHRLEPRHVRPAAGQQLGAWCRGAGLSPVTLHEDDIHNVVADMSLSLNLDIFFGKKKSMSEN